MEKISYSWDPDSGIATCTFRVGDKSFVGEAKCAEADLDMMSEFTGCTIALQRAQLKILIDERDNIIQPGLKALKQLYYSINCSKKFNSDSYETTMLLNQIQHYEDDLAYIKNAIEFTRRRLKQYLQDKEQFHENLRKIRKKENTSKE